MDIVHFISIVIGLLVISNPLMAVQAVLGVTANQTPAQKKQISIIASLVGGMILVVMTWAGTYLLAILGLKIESFQIAGGIVVIVLGFSMLNAQESSIKTTKEEQEAPSPKSGAIIPLAFPLIAGPGAISTVIVNASHFPGVLNLLILSLACILIAIISGIFIYSAGYLEKKLGHTGISIFGRIGGLILLTLGVQILMGGILHFFPALAAENL